MDTSERSNNGPSPQRRNIMTPREAQDRRTSIQAIMKDPNLTAQRVALISHDKGVERYQVADIEDFVMASSFQAFLKGKLAALDVKGVSKAKMGIRT